MKTTKMKTTKFLSVMALAGLFTFSSCTKDEETIVTQPVPTPSNVVEVTSNLTADATWETGKIYILRGRIAVESGATLTIQPGVIVKGQAGTGANASALLIARGAKLMAEGTSTEPIIFTAESDIIQPGSIVSPNLVSTDNGYWGGVIVLGKAKISAKGDVTEVQIEGIPTSDANGLYGGTDDTDNSGVIKYISIRHGGSNIGAGNEINGLTLGAVGSGTTIENVEIVANQDDGIEWFGGTVSVKNAISWNVGDDGFDTDQAWSGTLENFYSITPAGHMFELDGGEGTYQAPHTIKKGVSICSSSEVTSEDLINVDDNSEVVLENIYFTEVKTGQKINRVTAPAVTFTSIMINVPSDSLASHVNGAVPAGVTAGGSSPVDKTAFTGWSWADAAGKL